MERRILVVEDEPTVLQLLCDILEMEGYECRGLDHPQLVSDVVAHWQPDVILLDIMLPRRSGIEVAEELRAQGFSRTQLIALSAAGIMQDLAWQSELFGAVLRKPFDLHTLTQAVEQAMSHMGAASPWRAEDSTVAS